MARARPERGCRRRCRSCCRPVWIRGSASTACASPEISWRSAAAISASRWRRPAGCSRRPGSRSRTQPSRACTSAPKDGRRACGWRRSRSPPHPDRERFVAEFSGSERTVAAYLLAEVLERQPAEVRDLLLRTSILDRVSGPLADFLTGGSGSEAHPAATRGRERVRVLARRGPNVVPLPPSVRRPAPARAAAARSVDDRAASPRSRRVVRAARRHGGGDPPCAGGGRLADRGAHGRRQLRQPGLRRPAGDASRALLAGLPGGRRRHGPGAGARLREGPALRRPARGERPLHRGGGAPGRRGPRRAPAALRPAARGDQARARAPPRRSRHRARRRCGRSRLRWPRSRRAPGGSATTSGPPRS